MGRQADRNRMAAVMASARERMAPSRRPTWPRTHPPKHTVLAPRPRCDCDGCEAARARP